MHKVVAAFARKPFVRNVATMASGAAAAQAIALIFAPFITRLYGPDVLGVQGVFISIATFIAPVAALLYPMAIVLADDDREAISLCWLSAIIATGICVVLTLLLFLFGGEMLESLDAGEIAGLAYLIPLYALSSVISSVAAQWLIRKAAFGATAVVSVMQSLVVNLLKLGQGMVNPSAVALVAITIVGGLLNAVLMLLGLRKTLATMAGAPVSVDSAPGLRAVARRYRDFPLVRAPQVLINAASQLLPILMLAGYFGAASVGHYALATMVLALPAKLLGESVAQVFFSRISATIRAEGNVRGLIVKVTAAMALGGALPLLVVVAAGPGLFEFAFGDEWRTAGVYAQWLSVWLFFQFINRPAVAAIPSLNLQGGLLIYEFFSSGTKLLALYIGYFLYQSDVVAIALFSVVGTGAYVWLIIWVILRSGDGIVRRPQISP